MADVRLVDLSDQFCTRDRCVTVAADYLMYRDSHHLAVPYVLYLRNALGRQLAALRPDVVGPVKSWRSR